MTPPRTIPPDLLFTTDELRVLRYGLWLATLTGSDLDRLHARMARQALDSHEALNRRMEDRPCPSTSS